MLGRVSDLITSYSQMRWHNVHKFVPKVDIFFETESYIVRTISTMKELRQAFALRYQIFHVEMIGKPAGIGMDIDEYDFACDHLAIICKKTDQLVGTYRLNCSLFSDDFYSEREFEILNILATDGVKLELGRACIEQEHRKGSVISLLWRGIAEYMMKTNSKILFGCTSVKIKTTYEASLLHRYFHHNRRIDREFSTVPTSRYKMPGLELWTKYFLVPLSEAENAEALALIPPLCRAYLKAGATFSGEPAWDREFSCIDFLTILRVEDLNKVLWKKYKLPSEVQ
jgi:putative hemolysin